MIESDLLRILRCPACVSGVARREGADPGQLQLVHGTWLVCQEEGCGRKYPVVNDIPQMLIEKGDQWAKTPVEELPATPPADS